MKKVVILVIFFSFALFGANEKYDDYSDRLKSERRVVADERRDSNTTKKDEAKKEDKKDSNKSK